MCGSKSRGAAFSSQPVPGDLQPQGWRWLQGEQGAVGGDGGSQVWGSSLPSSGPLEPEYKTGLCFWACPSQDPFPPRPGSPFSEGHSGEGARSGSPTLWHRELPAWPPIQLIPFSCFPSQPFPPWSLCLIRAPRFLESVKTSKQTLKHLHGTQPPGRRPGTHHLQMRKRRLDKWLERHRLAKRAPQQQHPWAGRPDPASPTGACLWELHFRGGSRTCSVPTSTNIWGRGGGGVGVFIKMQ